MAAMGSASGGGSKAAGDYLHISDKPENAEPLVGGR